MPAMPAIITPDREKTELENALRRLSTQPRILARERRDLSTHPRQRLERLLNEIEEIVLPRSLHIQGSGEDIAVLHVANRRLHSMSLIDEPQEYRSLSNTSLNDIAMRVLAISKEMTEMRVKTLSSEVVTSEAATTISVSSLREALEIGHHHCNVDHLSRLLAPHAIASLNWVQDASHPEFQGDAKWEAVMTDCSQRIQSDYSDPVTAPSGTTGFATLLTQTEVIIVACDADKGICRIVPMAEGLRAISNWQTLLN